MRDLFTLYIPTLGTYQIVKSPIKDGSIYQLLLNGREDQCYISLDSWKKTDDDVFLYFHGYITGMRCAGGKAEPTQFSREELGC